jgi:hypothetical protein
LQAFASTVLGQSPEFQMVIAFPIWKIFASGSCMPGFRR